MGMSINSTYGTSSTSNLLQELNTISNPGGTGLPVTTYASEMQQALQLQLLTNPENQLRGFQSQQIALGALQSALQTLQSYTNTLAASQSWNTVTSSNSNTTDYNITVSNGATPSIYSIDIQGLAQNQIDVGTAGFTSTSQVIATGTFSISGTSATPITIDVTSTSETLQQFVNTINSYSYETYVSAGLIYNGSNYELSLASTKTGTSYAFSTSGTALSQFGFGATATVSATNAAMQVDGVNITSQNNTFVNPIPDVTVNALATGTGTVTLSSSSSTTIQNVQNWMNAYNSVVDLLKTDTSYTAPSNGGSATSGPLFNDVVGNTLNTSLPTAVMQSVTNSTESSLSSLASVGIVIDPTSGHLEFQPSSGFGIGGSVSLPDGQTTFTNALNQDSQAVQSLFGVISSGSLSTAYTNTGVLGNLTNLLNTYLIGANGQTAAFTGDTNSIQQQETNVNNYITTLNQQISTQVANFTKQLNALNSAMQNSKFQSSQLSALINGSTTTASTGG